MIFSSKRSTDGKQGKQDLDALHDAIAKLPPAKQRDGLKQEMLSSILATVERPEPRPVREQKRRMLPRLGFSLTVVGCALSLALVIHLMPPTVKQNANPGHAADSGLRSASGMIDEDAELRKKEREQKLLQQLMPHRDGTYIGEGVDITVDDKDARLIRKGMFTDSVQTNLDLYAVVQEIYENGGNIVSINGILVEPYTEIVTRGALTEVQDHRITSPFTIKVIGDSETLYAKLTASKSVLQQLEENSGATVQVVRNNDVQIGLNKKQ